ncbi:MAG: PSP1 domain-containing protein [Flavobacteriaceae bacterium]
MSCNTCSTNGIHPGCKSNGSCGEDSCNKLTVFDWLSNMQPEDQTSQLYVEVRFKNSRKEFYKNSENLSLHIGDVVSTQSKSGHDVGIVSLTGPLVGVQMKKKGIEKEKDELQKIYRKASSKDISVWQSSRDKEKQIQKRAREIIIHLNLQMKLSDVEFQGDGSKATFYYTAEERVDFRQLIKELAKAFGIRIEMRQIGYRQEAQRLGGIGSCGRELCCSSWLSDFRSVSTSAARYQQLALNPQKLAGQCGKLKCCLNYELDTYLEALKDFPPTDCKLQTEKGVAYCQKTDIFKELLWFTYRDEPSNWHEVHKDVVQEIIEINKSGKKISSIEDYIGESSETEEIKSYLEKDVLEDSITRFDKPKNKKRRKSKNRPRNKQKTKS